MPSQQGEIAETIAALRRVREREKRGSSARPIYGATNRGNKLYRGAEHVRSGVLANTYGPERFREKVDHAGYARYIVERNPPRRDYEGNELGDSEGDEEADAHAADENPYSGIKLEEVLCPLRHPSELATHPSLSVPFLDPALPEMVKSTEKKLQQERANLWRAKNLNRQFIGDIPWIPCGAIETKDDWDMFEPRPNGVAGLDAHHQNNPEDFDTDQRLVSAKETANGIEHGLSTEANSISPQDTNNQPYATTNGTTVTAAEAVDQPHLNAEKGEDHPIEDTTMLDSEERTDSVVKDEINPAKPSADADTEPGEANELAEMVGEEQEGSDADSPPQPTRRITRALAAEANGSSAPTPPLSPTSALTDASDSSLLQVDPIFLVPLTLGLPRSATRGSELLAAVSNLPAEEAQDIRKLLTLYIQKQEESVRGYEAVLGKLIKAKRLRDDVLEMCKAEGHVGEMSDGEDWIDHQRWGLTPNELKKGKDDEDDAGEEREVAGIAGRKGKRRRNQ